MDSPPPNSKAAKRATRNSVTLTYTPTLPASNVDELIEQVQQLDAKLVLAYETGNAEKKRIEEELLFAKREVEELKKKLERALETYLRETTKLRKRNTELKNELDRTVFRLKEGGDSLSRLQFKVKLLSTHIEERENKVWSFLFTESPQTPNEFGEMIHAEGEDFLKSLKNYSENPQSALILTHSESTNSLEISAELTARLRSYDFNMWNFKEVEMISILEFIFEDSLPLAAVNVTSASLHRFLTEVVKHMTPNPFHNFIHAFTVTQMLYHFTKVMKLNTVLSHLELFSLLVSGVCHDLEHPGLNNPFQVNSRSVLATIYNDISPLENHHCATAFKLINDPRTSLFESGLPTETYKEFREIVINNILATDMARHFEMVSKFEDALPSFSWEQRDDKQICLQLLVKLADVSNELRPWNVAKPWADRLLEEFFAQTEMEAQTNVPVTTWMLRENVVQSQMQVNFVDHILLPMYSSMGKLFPELSQHIERLNVSRKKWNDIYQVYLEQHKR